MAFTHDQREKIKTFLQSHKAMGHSACAKELKKIGIDVNESTIRDYRRVYAIPFDAKFSVVSKYCMHLIKQGTPTTGRELIERFGITENYACTLAKKVNIKVRENKHKQSQAETKNHLRGRSITRTGNVTTHRMI